VGFGLDVAAKATALFLLARLAHAALGCRRTLARSVLWNAAMNLSRRLVSIDQSRAGSICLVRRPARLSLATSVVALAGLLGAVEPARSMGEAAVTPYSPRPDPAQQPKPKTDSRPQAGGVVALDEIIAALRAEEEKYRDIEYSLRITTRKV